jgi:hypothetical protein
MMQIVTWVRNADGFKVGGRVGDLLHIPVAQIEAMDFPSSHFAPQFGDKLWQIYAEEHSKNGPTTWRMMSFPFLRVRGFGTVPVAILLIFEREGGQWTRTIGHAFVLAPPCWLRLPTCCRNVTCRLAEALMGNATEVDLAA